MLCDILRFRGYLSFFNNNEEVTIKDFSRYFATSGPVLPIERDLFDRAKVIFRKKYEKEARRKDKEFWRKKKRGGLMASLRRRKDDNKDNEDDTSGPSRPE